MRVFFDPWREQGWAGRRSQAEPALGFSTAPLHRQLCCVAVRHRADQLGAEVVWVRIYTFSLGTVVYAFAAILANYLVGTYIGSWIYRRKPRTGTLENGLLWLGFGVLVLFAYLTADPRIPLHGVLRVILGITPFATLAGFITPLILDRFSAGDPDRAGKAYAINIAGCVLGPLLAGFVLLPLLGERLALCLLAAPWLILGLRLRLASSLSIRGALRPSSAFSLVLVIASIALTIWAEGYESLYLRAGSGATVRLPWWPMVLGWKGGFWSMASE